MKKKIALVVNTLSYGGEERSAANLSRGLSGKYDIDIVLNDEAHIDYPYEGRIISLRMPTNLKHKNTVYQIMALLRRIRVLQQMKKSGKYSAIISFSELSNAANALSINRSVKTIVSVHISICSSVEKGIKQRLFMSCALPFICRKADLTVSCSNEIAEELINGYGLAKKKSAVIYNGLPLTSIRERAEEPLPDLESIKFNQKKLLVTSGRLTYQKGQWHLLPVMKYLRDAGLPVCLVILGEGELRPLMEERIARLGLSDCVLMPGFVENPYPYLARADAFVMPSIYEGFSNAILEAMACGAPVISSDHKTGAREILAPDTDYRGKISYGIKKAAYGILVPVCSGGVEDCGEELTGEELLMAEAIREVLTDEDLAVRYRKASLERAEQLAIERICEQWIEVIEAR